MKYNVGDLIIIGDALIHYVLKVDPLYILEIDDYSVSKHYIYEPVSFYNNYKKFGTAIKIQHIN